MKQLLFYLVAIISFSSFGQYSGTFSVGATGYFPTLTDACDSIEMYGIDGPLVIDIESGNYFEKIELLGYAGSSETNTITFQSITGDANDVLIQDSLAIDLQGATVGNLAFKNLNIVNDVGQVVRINGANNIVFESCKITGVPSGPTSLYTLFRTNSLKGDFLVTKCQFSNGYAALQIHYDYNTPLENGNIEVVDCEFNDFYRYGVTIDSGQKSYIARNIMTGGVAGFSNTYALSVDNVSDTTIIENNQLHSINGYVVDLSYTYAPVYIRNNMIAGTGSSTLGVNFNTFLDELHVYNNSIYTGGTCLYGFSDFPMEVHNNILHSFNGGNIIFIDYVDFDTGLPVSNYNAVYTTNPEYYFYGEPDFSGYSLEGWQTTYDQDTNSFILLDPLFVSLTDLHTCNDSIIGVGTNLYELEADIDGDQRVGTPSIGADFWINSNYNLFELDSTYFCSGDAIELIIPYGNDVVWSTGGIEDTITVVSPGIYSVEVMNECAVIKDTIEFYANDPVASFSTIGTDFTYDFINNSVNGDNYLWDFGDGNTSILNNPSHTYAANGDYVVTLTVTNECGTDVTTANYSLTVGTTKLSGLDVLIYPNPVEKLLQIKNDNLTHIEVMNTLGELVLVTQVSTSQYEVDFSNLESGVYLVNLHTEDSLVTYRVVKQ